MNEEDERSSCALLRSIARLSFQRHRIHVEHTVVSGLVAARPDSSAERLHDPRRTPWYDTPLAKIFAGTPEFASPEQFAGVGVDIRSDLYSLGVTLWAMVTFPTKARHFILRNARRGCATDDW